MTVESSRYKKRPFDPAKLHLYCISKRTQQEIVLVISWGMAEEALRVLHANGYAAAEWCLATTTTRLVNRNVEGPARIVGDVKCLRFSPTPEIVYVGGDDARA